MPSRPPSRRRVLGLGLAASALLATAWHSVGHLGSYPPLPFPARALTPKSAAILAVLGDWLLPPGGPLPGSGGDLETLRLIDELLADLPPHHAMLMQALPLAFEHGSALDRFGADRLTAMSTEERQAYLDRWFQAKDLVHAQLLTGLKMLWNASYLERPDVQRAMGTPYLCAVPA
jgi:hypothetical protein